MAYAIISEGVVANTVEATPAFARNQGWVLLPDEASIGWLYDGKAFTAPPAVDPEPADPYAHFVPVPLLRQRLEKLGMFEDFSTYLAQSPALTFKVLTLERGVDPAYPELAVAFEAMSVPQTARDYLLADPSVGVPDLPSE